jgi:hypothetical protein
MWRGGVGEKVPMSKPMNTVAATRRHSPNTSAKREWGRVGKWIEAGEEGKGGRMGYSIGTDAPGIKVRTEPVILNFDFQLVLFAHCALKEVTAFCAAAAKYVRERKRTYRESRKPNASKEFTERTIKARENRDLRAQAN